MELKSASQIKGIIWDWNGTLLNDTNLVGESMNGIHGKRGLPVIKSQNVSGHFALV